MIFFFQHGSNRVIQDFRFVVIIFLIFSFVSLKVKVLGHEPGLPLLPRETHVCRTYLPLRTDGLSQSESSCEKGTNCPPHPHKQPPKGGLCGHRSLWDLLLRSWGIFKTNVRYFHEIPDFIFLDSQIFLLWLPLAYSSLPENSFVFWQHWHILDTLFSYHR